jgi:hypothetical protein
MMTDSIWKTLSAIDCSDHVETKGKFSYLAWTWAWAMVKEKYPEALYALEDDIVYPDGTMEVRVGVHIEGLMHTMWLPVLNFQNKAIQNPNAFDINTARMRCLTKCLAMFGLGHYIYAGESAPQEQVTEETPLMIRAGAEINACFESDDYPGAAQLWDEWSQDELAIIARAPSKGGQLTTANRTKMKETAFRHALNEVRGISMEGVEQ